ncbi:hypothetical protein CEXT_810221 [Caerostris extrusa]|uniref:Uncharacterized protein n=1 Tax=Caerostris extrusa TaxID=172846 RepID=A0AAV4UD40_CAEEX|nr:hypothetical protein CEXT_810221 [Caerostris extrusa]
MPDFLVLCYRITFNETHFYAKRNCCTPPTTNRFPSTASPPTSRVSRTNNARQMHGMTENVARYQIPIHRGGEVEVPCYLNRPSSLPDTGKPSALVSFKSPLIGIAKCHSCRFHLCHNLARIGDLGFPQRYGRDVPWATRDARTRFEVLVLLWARPGTERFPAEEGASVPFSKIGEV